MDTISTSPDSLLLQLPKNLHQQVLPLWEHYFSENIPLHLVVVGAFSTGKSTLLNTLLGQTFLKSAMEESTALPTFVEYGNDIEMSLVGADGSVTVIDAERFARDTTSAPQGTKCAKLSLPVTWLENLNIIDLPGLGSTSVSHKNYTMAQVEHADIVLYLLSPRGPTQQDLDMLKMVIASGKKVQILVSQWDLIEAAALRGERMPNLEVWHQQVEQAVGKVAPFIACHHQGLGINQILAFINSTKNQATQIRVNRFQKALKALLSNELDLNELQQQANEVNNEEQAQAFHRQLIEQRQQLLQFKLGLQENQQNERQQVKKNVKNLADQALHQLAQTLASIAEQINEWDHFLQTGHDELKLSLYQLSKEMTALSQGYGDLTLLAPEIAALNLRLPEPEPIKVEDFLDYARLERLSAAINANEKKQQELAQTAAVYSQNLADSAEAELEHFQQLKALNEQKNSINSQPIAMREERVQGTNASSQIGRMVGELADIGVMFVMPMLAGVKAASVLGKSAATAAKVAQQLKNAETFSQVSVLEKISFAYWGEQIGSRFDDESQINLVVDEEAQAARNQVLSQIDSQITSVRQALNRQQDLANQYELTGWALEESQRQSKKLSAEIEQLQQMQKEKFLHAQQLQNREQEQALNRQQSYAQQQWLRQFNQQAAAMQKLLLTSVKQHWETQVHELVEKRLSEINLLTQKAEQSQSKKQQEQEELKIASQQINSALALLP